MGLEGVARVALAPRRDETAVSDRRTEYPRFRLLVAFSSWALSMFEEKRGDERRLSMTRVTVAFMAVVFAGGVKFPLGWPDAFLGFCILFAIGIAKAVDGAPAKDVLAAVTGMFGKGAEAATGWMSERTAAWGTRAVDDPTLPRGSAQVEP